MTSDLKKLLKQYKKAIEEDRKRLGNFPCEITKYVESENEKQNSDKRDVCAFNVRDEEKKNVLKTIETECKDDLAKKKNAPLVEPLDLSFNEGTVERKKQLFIEKLVDTENPLTFRSNESHKSAMFRYGEYSPNNPSWRVTAAPYLGLGEYEQKRQILQKQRKNDYLEHLSKKASYLKGIEESVFAKSNPISPGISKSVQTDIQNIRNNLVQYELHSQDPAEKELSPQAVISDKENHIMHSNRSSILSRIDNQYSGTANSIYSAGMDKPRSILSNRRTESPRDRLMQDLKHSYVPSFMDGFSYQDKTEELQRERLKRELYQQELRMQIEEKRRLATMREEQERLEQELENKRLEQQLLRMQEEQIRDEQRRNRRDEQMRRNSEEFIRRKQEIQSRHGYRKHTESESSVTSLRNTNVASKQMSHYSPPVSRRNPYSYNIPSSSVFAEPLSRYNPNRYDFISRKDTLNRMDSLNIRDTNTRLNSFSRYDSLSRIDTLNRQDALNRLESLNIKDSLNRVQRRHSATQQDLSMMRRSPKPQRRNSSGRFDDTLPIPVLKAHSPVAKELKNSVAISSSRHSSDAVRRLEDKWQVPAVQKNILNHGDFLHDGPGRSILTQLGAIRMQLQQEQLRMDETLRKRGISQSKAVDFH